MKNPSQFTSCEELRAYLAGEGIALPLSERPEQSLGKPVALGARTLRNSIAIQPMEGCDACRTGEPDELTHRRYRRFAESGAGLIWFEATAVLPEARANPHQLYITKENVHFFAELVEEIRAISMKKFGWSPVILMQATHSGRFSKPNGAAEPIIAYENPYLNKNVHAEKQTVISDDELKRLEEKMGEAAAVLASESIKQGKTLRETDLEPIIKRLSETGCYDKANDMGLCFLEKQYIYTPKVLAANKAELEKAFESDEPGLGVWSYISGNAKVSDSEMTELLGAEKKNVRYGAALCLGIIGHHEALTVIREMFADTYPLANVPGKVSSPWASFYPSDIQAIILLGRFADKESAEELLEIVRDGGRKRAAHFTETKHSVAKPVQYFEYAAKAVLDIAEKHGDSALKSALKYALSSSDILKGGDYLDSVKKFEGKL